MTGTHEDNEVKDCMIYSEIDVKSQTLNSYYVQKALRVVTIILVG